MYSEKQVEFVRSCNDHLQVAEGRPLNQRHLQRLSDHFDITPIAFVNSGNHWTLAVRRTDSGIEVYDPREGLRELALGEIERIWYFPKGGRRQHIPQYFLANPYNLPREKLEELGVLQESAAGSCGQLCVFAANYAKRV